MPLASILISMKKMTEKVYFSLGSNEGDRRRNIEKALAMMDEAFGKSFSLLSSIIETKSWGFDGADFLNCAVLYELEEDPFSVLEKCEMIEYKLGRKDKNKKDSSGRRVYSDRPIDIDILLYGDRIIDTERLTLPHPLIGERDFVSIPLREIISTK